MNATPRQFVSPYARKLARERGVRLQDLAGTGPAGRIVSADVLAFAPMAAPGPVACPPEPAAEPGMVIGAITTTVRIARLRELMAEFSSAGIDLRLNTLVLRAAALALRDRTDGMVGLEEEGGVARRLIIAQAAGLSVGALQSRLDAPMGNIQADPVLSIRGMTRSGIRALLMPLVHGYRLRLTFSQNEGTAELLLGFDARRLTEDDASDLLAEIRDGLETPLRLFV